MTPENMIDFPPLPEPEVGWETDYEGGVMQYDHAFSERQMRDYVAADRAKRQAEPVAWIDSRALAWLRTASGAQAYVMSALHKSAQDGDEPIYTAAPSPVQAPLIPCRLQELWNDAMQANPQSTTDAAMDFARAVEVEHGINCPW